jgi:hypothetical protein
MAAHGGPAVEETGWEKRSIAAAPTIGWFLRRSALWAGILLIGIVFACALYAFASDTTAGSTGSASRSAALKI